MIGDGWRVIDRMIEPNMALDALIDAAGMSRVGLADRINRANLSKSSYDHRSVGRWIAGQVPREPTPELIRAILSQALRRDLSREDIGMGGPKVSATSTPISSFVDRAPTLWRADQQHTEGVRRLKLITGLEAIAPVWEWENPPEDTDVSHRGVQRVGETDIAVLRAARDRYEQMYRAAGGVVARERVVTFLAGHAAPLMHGSYTDTAGRQLHRAVGGLVAVAGICTYDAEHQGLAQRYFHQALRLAKASGDRAFGGYVLALLVNQALSHNDYSLAVAFAEAGLRTAGPHITPALATDLHGMQAKAFARMHDTASARHWIRQTETAEERIHRSEEPPETGYVQPGLVNTQLAEALLALGDIKAATEHAEQAVHITSHPRGRVNRLVTATRVAMASGELDRAAQTANEMLDSAAGMESRKLHARFQTLREDMADKNSSTLKDVVERLDVELAVPL